MLLLTEFRQYNTDTNAGTSLIEIPATKIIKVRDPFHIEVFTFEGKGRVVGKLWRYLKA